MKKLLAMLLVVVMVLSLVACGAKEESNTLTIGIAQDINNLNPQMQADQINNNCITLSHQGLIYLKNPAEQAATGSVYGPMIAESWEWEDENTLVFHLYEGIKFSDGSACTAEDCVFTYEMAMKPESNTSGTLSLLTGVEARDELTFVIYTSSYSNDLMSALSTKPLVIQSKDAWEDPNNKEPWLIGTGQYKLESWVEGQAVTYVKNENYWCTDTEGMNRPGVADKIIFKPLLEATSRVMALQNGEIDVCVDPLTTELQFLEKDENLVVHTEDGTRLFYFGFNCQDPDLSNITLRQAISCAIDKEAIVQIVLGGMGKAQDTVVNRGVPTFYNEPDLGAYTYDVERAKALLTEAGYAPGELTFDLYAATDDPYKTIAPLIQNNLKEIGITVNIVSLDQATLKSECQTGNHQLFLWRWNVIDRLSEIYSELFDISYASNYHHYDNPTVNDMAYEILTLQDQDARTAKSIELQKLLAEEAPQVPLYVADLVIAYRAGLTGTYFFGGGNHVWTHAYVAK